MFSISAMWLSQEILVHDNRCRGNTISFNLISITVLENVIVLLSVQRQFGLALKIRGNACT